MLRIFTHDCPCVCLRRDLHGKRLPANLREPSGGPAGAPAVGSHGALGLAVPLALHESAIWFYHDYSKGMLRWGEHVMVLRLTF